MSGTRLRFRPARIVPVRRQWTAAAMAGVLIRLAAIGLTILLGSAP